MKGRVSLSNPNEAGRQLVGGVKSIYAAMQKVFCPMPTRERDDDKVVEVFLRAYQQGRFAEGARWLPQYEKNVEVVAKAGDGTRLAIEHTRVFAFDGHMQQEEVLRPIAECLEAVRLPAADRRWIQIRLQPRFMGRLLHKHQILVRDELSKWATLTLPTIPPRFGLIRHFLIPVPLPNGKRPEIGIDVEVWPDMDVQRPIKVSGWLPQGRRLDSQVKQALTNKLKKLARAEADVRFLMIDLPSHTDSDISVADVIRGIKPEFPLLDEIDGVIFAMTFGLKSEGCAFFRLWNASLEPSADYLQVNIN